MTEVGFKIDVEFKALIPLLSAEEFSQLESNIKADGCRDPLVVWAQEPKAETNCSGCECDQPKWVREECIEFGEETRGLAWKCEECGEWEFDDQFILIDGHNRYAICEKHNVGFETVEMSFADRDEAKEWIIRNQFGRRNLTAMVRAELALKLEPLIAARAKENVRAGGGSGNSGRQKSDNPVDTKKQLASVAGVSHDTIHKVKVLQDKGSESLKQKTRSGEISINAATLIAEYPQAEQNKIVALSEKEIVKAAKEIKQRQSTARVEKRRAEMIDRAENATPKLVNDWKIINGDCVDELSKIERGSVQLIFTDPPYNIGIDYGDGKEADLKEHEAYMSWVDSWLLRCKRSLSDNGSLWVMINDEYVADYALSLRSLGFTIRNWVIWYESFGVNCDNKFNRTHRHILHAVKSAGDFIFNSDAPRLRRPSARQTVYGDSRANPDGKLLDDVWTHIPRVVGTSTERIPDFPTQLPVELVATIVDAASNPGDTVVDPFNGSGTTGVAAIRSGRKYIGIEKNKDFHAMAEIRLRGEQ